MNTKLLWVEEHNWKQLDEQNRDTTLFFLVISPLEEHGPHLPVGTDISISRDVAEGVALEIGGEKPNLNCLMLPVFPLGIAKSMMDFPGTISMRKKTVSRCVHDVCLSLARHGFRYLVIFTFHMDLRHLKAISQAIRKAQRNKIAACEPLSRFFYSQEKGKEMHADVMETSYMLYRYPHLVKQEYKTLPPVVPHDLETPRAFFRTIREMGATNGYLGSPAKASQEKGQKFREKAIHFCTTYVNNWYQGNDVPELPKKIRWMMKFC